MSLECSVVVCEQSLWNEKSIQIAKDANLFTAAYTVNERHDMNSLFALGVDSIITDRVRDFQPDKKKGMTEFVDKTSTHIQKSQRLHCVRCHGPLVQVLEIEDTEAMIEPNATQMKNIAYVTKLKAQRVVVPLADLASDNYYGPHYDYHAIAHSEKVIMENRRYLIANVSEETSADNELGSHTFEHIPENVAQFCSRCMHQMDLPEMGKL